MISKPLNNGKQPRLTLVGAGPGDPDLLTVGALKVLRTADIVLYDALVSEEILAHVPPGVPGVSVGKRAGMHVFSQDEINKLIVRYAFQLGHVVRLKGGDPFVFGRGYEELEYAERHGVPVDVIPGISSALAVPENLRIPVTLRGVSESFWVITGTTQSGELSSDVALAARSTATVVILMGMRKIREIMDLFIAHGRDHVPVAVIENGTLPDEKWIVADVSSVADHVRDEGMNSPAVIVIGQVAALASKAAAVSPAEVRRTA